ncbi:metal ABC transporter permease [Kribbella antibiotica]|uniref:metal ABC transporter permease n=1 Tax=Kribbella antibiotica TaxID=190195 RepID=UPI001EE146F2|nr:metal ABC transporter permease [Kribbella antibiotica]
MDWLTAPFEVTFVQRALWGGILVSLICALAGTWVVLRGMAFLGDAMAHGMLPGVALASLQGGNLLGTDGQIHVIDPEAGKVTKTISVLTKWQEPLEWQEARPGRS